MKNCEDILKALECCTYGAPEQCDVCPYKGDCRQKDVDALKLVQEYKAKLDCLTAPVSMPDYEVEYNRLHCENAELYVQINEMREELTYLRAIKAAAEAFLGREIK